MMESYSLPTGSPFAKPENSQQSPPLGKLPNKPQPLQAGRKRSHKESQTSASKTSSSPIEKRREEKIMENKARFSKLEKALQQRKAASSAKLLPLSYRNDPMRYVFKSCSPHFSSVGTFVFSWLHFHNPMGNGLVR